MANDALLNFDADMFESQIYNEANAVRRAILDEGTVLIKEIVDYNIRKPRAGKNAAGESYVSPPTLNLRVRIEDEMVREKFGVKPGEECIHFIGVQLDVDPSTGMLDMGPNKNVRLGQLRKALGQNIPGRPWSFGSLKGHGPFYAAVSHYTPEGRDEVFERINSFTEAEPREVL